MSLPTGSRNRVPAEVRVPALIAAAGALVFLLVGVVRWQTEADAAVLRVPIAVTVLELLVAAGLIAGLRPARLVGIAVLALVALLHLLIVLGAGLWWTRVLSGVLSAVHVYAIVLLTTGPARRHLGGA